MRGGFLHLNSDLLFEPGPAADAAGLARRECRHRRSATSAPGSDMMKAEMNGRRILRMGKRPDRHAAAEVVGPAKFGPAARNALSAAVAARRGGDRGRWADSVLRRSWAVPAAGRRRAIPGCFGPKSIRRPMPRRLTAAFPDCACPAHAARASNQRGAAVCGSPLTA